MILRNAFIIIAIALVSSLSLWVFTVHFLRPDRLLQQDYKTAAISWAASIGLSDICLGKDSAALLQPEAEAGAIVLRPSWFDAVLGIRHRQQEDLLLFMRLARVEAVMKQDDCSFAATTQSATGAALRYKRDRLKTENAANAYLNETYRAINKVISIWELILTEMEWMRGLSINPRP
jgi:hypothetical protein